MEGFSMCFSVNKVFYADFDWLLLFFSYVLSSLFFFVFFTVSVFKTVILRVPNLIKRISTMKCLCGRERDAIACIVNLMVVFTCIISVNDDTRCRVFWMIQIYAILFLVGFIMAMQIKTSHSGVFTSEQYLNLMIASFIS